MRKSMCGKEVLELREYSLWEGGHFLNLCVEVYEGVLS